MIRLVSLGYHYSHRDGIMIDRPTGAGNYAFVFFKSRAEVSVNGHSEYVDKNHYIVFSPNTTHYYRDLEKPFVNDWFHCEGSCLEQLLDQLDFPLDKPVKAIDPHMISKRIMELQNTVREEGPFSGQIVDLELKSLLMRLGNSQAKTSVPEKAGRYFLPLSQLRNELYSSPSIRLSVEELASRVNLSKSYFQHIYKELFGCSVMTDMINGRLEYAKYLLINTQLSVAEIAKLCGYENETHFMRQFKKFVGMRPSRYKAAAR